MMKLAGGRTLGMEEVFEMRVSYGPSKTVFNTLKAAQDACGAGLTWRRSINGRWYSDEGHIIDKTQGILGEYIIVAA